MPEIIENVAEINEELNETEVNEEEIDDEEDDDDEEEEITESEGFVIDKNVAMGAGAIIALIGATGYGVYKYVMKPKDKDKEPKVKTERWYKRIRIRSPLYFLPKEEETTE